MKENYNQLFWQTGAPEFYLLSHGTDVQDTAPVAKHETQDPGGEEAWRNKPIL